MATPTPSSASKRAAGSVSTPSHLNQSSPPRSVPSPATARHPAGKTPVNHPTTGSSTGSKTLASTPMVQNLSQAGHNTSSPANLLSYSTPNGLGIDGVTPAGLNLPTPGPAGAVMMPTLSDLGLTSSGGKRNEDEERRAKMRKVLKSIGKPKGRVSEEGITRVSRRVGFANDIDAEKLTPSERERKVGNRPISTAGNAVVIDVDLKNHVPQSVQVMYSAETKTLAEKGQEAGRVLLEDLRAPDGIAMNAKLDRFGMNLERLARIDRLSANGVNCFEALSGIHASLSKLFEQEMLLAKAGAGPDTPGLDAIAEMEVKCKKSGRSVVHAHGKLGLEIIYWDEGRHHVRSDERAGDQMEIDEKASEQEATHISPIDDNKSFSLRIEPESSPAGLYPSLRVSEHWLADPLELPQAGSGQSIPWQEPPSTLVPTAAGGDAMAIDGQGILPDLRFVAKLDPPVVMPWRPATDVFTRVGLPGPVLHPARPQYASLLLTPAMPQPSSVAFTVAAEQEVLSLGNGEETTVRHSYGFSSAKPDCGFVIEELPFSHPQQLIEILPILRQWAFIGSLLKSTLRNRNPSQKADEGTNGAKHVNGSANGHATLDDLLAQDPKSHHGDRMDMNIALTTSPVPMLEISFPTSQEGATGNLALEVLNNAVLAVASYSGFADGDATEKTEKSIKFAKALDACGDLGVWIEWLRAQS